MSTSILLICLLCAIILSSVSIIQQQVIGQNPFLPPSEQQQNESSQSKSSNLMPAATKGISAGFQEYQSPTYGISIIYPTGWKIMENETSSMSSIFSFRSPEPAGQLATLVSVDIKNAGKFLDTTTMTLKEHTPREYALGKLALPPDWNVKTIREKAITIAGHPAWRLEYTFTPSFVEGLTSYNVVTDFINNGKVYYIEYSSDPLKVPNTLPIYDKMVQSLQLTR